jgi:hypothetical protein
VKTTRRWPAALHSPYRVLAGDSISMLSAFQRQVKAWQPDRVPVAAEHAVGADSWHDGHNRRIDASPEEP